MKVLVIGSGGREHAIAWKISQSDKKPEIFAAPGNPGIAEFGKNVNIKADDNQALLRFAKKEKIDLTIVGPEIPLALGIVDLFQEAGLRIWGPSKNASKLEGSKVEMKEFLKKHKIPTADFKIFNEAEDAHNYIEEVGAPIVVKCDGLAAGKGVTVAATEEEAHEAITKIMEEHIFGEEAGSNVVIEEMMVGEEISIFAFCDGHNAIVCDSAQDHKQVFDGDKGANTGGMGAFTPAPGLMTEEDENIVVEKILVPTMSGCVSEERPYVGILYMGLMLTERGPRVVEYNVRFGDPECQPLMMRLENDIIDVFNACIDGKLNEIELSWTDDIGICITLASGGYPADYESGKEIVGLDEVGDATVFHAGTKLSGDKLQTAGGRVLSVCAKGKTLDEAREKAYAASEKISFEGKHYRTDIGYRHGK